MSPLKAMRMSCCSSSTESLEPLEKPSRAWPSYFSATGETMSLALSECDADPLSGGPSECQRTTTQQDSAMDTGTGGKLVL